MDPVSYPELSFDEKSHTYRLDGIVIPNVTSIMAPLSDYYYGKIRPNVLSQAAQRGTIVHHAIETYLLYGLDDIPPEYAQYLNAFKKWMADVKPDIISAEGRVYHKLLRYAGSADLLFLDDGLETVCADFKTTSEIVDMLVRVQLSAYAKAFQSHGIDVSKKLVVHLDNDGGYTERYCPAIDNDAYGAFCALLTIRSYVDNNSGRK